jgi:hypothetical protein
LSRATFDNIRQNVALAPIMAGGMPIHELSVLIVILNGMRLMRFTPGTARMTGAPILVAQSSAPVSVTIEPRLA